MADDHHNNSYVISFRYDDFRYLTTGDAEEKAEERLVKHKPGLLEADVYHAGHHASDTSSTEDFLTEVRPNIAIVSSDNPNQYGHPDDEVMERFSDIGIITYWTAVHGNLTIFSDGADYVVEADKDATTDGEELLDRKEERDDG